MVIYLVEDDDNIRELIVYTLCKSGLNTEGFEKPSDFYSAIKKTMPDIVLLDVMLPEESGIDILKKLRDNDGTKKLPVMMLTARDSEYDKVLGLDSGADDYMTKPLSMMELVSRVRALLRRTGTHDDDGLRYRDLYVNAGSHTVKANGKQIQLTLKEFEMLVLLLEHKGTVLTRDRLLNDIWGYSFDGESRTVDVHIRTLRSKLKECGSYIETVRGMGYKIVERDEQ